MRLSDADLMMPRTVPANPCPEARVYRCIGCCCDRLDRNCRLSAGRALSLTERAGRHVRSVLLRELPATMLVDWIWDRMESSGGALQFTDRLEWPGGFCAGGQPVALGHLVEGREQLGPVLARLEDGGLQAADRDGEANA